MGLEDSESRTSPGLVAQEDLSGMPREGAGRGVRSARPSPRPLGCGQSGLVGGLTLCIGGILGGGGPPCQASCDTRGWSSFSLSLPDPFLSARVDSFLETRPEAPSVMVGAAAPAGSGGRKRSGAHKVAAECHAGMKPQPHHPRRPRWLRALQSAGGKGRSQGQGRQQRVQGGLGGGSRGQTLPGCGGQSVGVGGQRVRDDSVFLAGAMETWSCNSLRWVV